jgi:hypothetical protein
LFDYVVWSLGGLVLASSKDVSLSAMSLDILREIESGRAAPSQALRQLSSWALEVQDNMLHLQAAWFHEFFMFLQALSKVELEVRACFPAGLPSKIAVHKITKDWKWLPSLSLE